MNSDKQKAKVDEISFRFLFFYSIPYFLMLGLVLFFLEKDLIRVEKAWPPKLNSKPLEILLQQTAIAPGDKFKGRVALLLAMDGASKGDWGAATQILYHYKQEIKYHLNVNLPGDNIPLINQYAHWTSPPTLALNYLAFGRPDDYIERAGRNLRVYRAKLARLLGTSIVVSDQPIANEKSLYSASVGGEKMFISKIENANLGQYSPVNVEVAPSAKEIITSLQSTNFDGEISAVVESPINSNLVKARNVSVYIRKGPILQVDATSDGISLLVLPFEFSYCLTATGKGLVDIIPINLAQTGLLITNQASVIIDYKYGVLSGTECRGRDLVRIKALNLENAATGRLFTDLRPKNQAP